MAKDRPEASDDLETLARTVYGEARGEGYRGQLAVAYVVRNRADRPSWWGRSVRDVCLKPYQFSCWNQDDPNVERIKTATFEDSVFRSCYRAALTAYDRAEADPTGGATHYHTIAAPSFAQVWPPKWALEMIPTASIGAHSFLREVA